MIPPCLSYLGMAMGLRPKSAAWRLKTSRASFLPPGSSLNAVIVSRRTLSWVDVFLP